MSGIGITRLDLTAAELCAAAGQSRDAKSASRMLALALVLEGVDRTRAAETCGVRRVRKLSGGTVSPTNGHRTNAKGLAGLSDRWKGGRVPRLVPAQMADLGASGRGWAGLGEGWGGALAQAGPAAPDCRRLRGRGA